MLIDKNNALTTDVTKDATEDVTEDVKKDIEKILWDYAFPSFAICAADFEIIMSSTRMRRDAVSAAL